MGVYANTMTASTPQRRPVSITNTGDITADASSSSRLAVRQRYNGTTVANAGNIAASGYYANGVVARDVWGNVVVDNQAGGTIVADGSGGDATGVFAQSVFGSATVYNAGDISATSNGRATGVITDTGYGLAEIHNSGNISAHGVGMAMGAVMYGNEVARLTNDGTIVADAHASTYQAMSYGSIAVAGISVTLNYGSITSGATVDGDGLAVAFGALGYGDAVTIVNEGTIASAGDVSSATRRLRRLRLRPLQRRLQHGYIGATALGHRQRLCYGVTSIVSGARAWTTIDAASPPGGRVQGKASRRRDHYGLYAAYVPCGAIVGQASTIRPGGRVFHVQRLQTSPTAMPRDEHGITSSARARRGPAGEGRDNPRSLLRHAGQRGGLAVSAAAGTGYAYATGAKNTDYYGLSTVTNTGDITVNAASGWGIAEANGVDSFGLYGGSIDNSGTITAVATVDRGYAMAYASSLYSPGADVATTSRRPSW